MKRVWLLHFFANALIVWLIYQWLGIRDARAWQLMLTVVAGLAIAAGTVYLHGGTFHWFARGNWKVPRERLLRFAALLLLFLVICGALALVPRDRVGQWIGSFLTLQFRKPVPPEAVAPYVAAVLWIAQWFVVPVLLLGQGRHPRFWLRFGAILFFCLYLPGRLIGWVPQFESTSAQVASFLARFVLAYCLTVTGWLAVIFLTSRGRPEASQPITAALP